MTARTSLTHPLRIDELSCRPWATGTIEVTFCPGKCGESLFGSSWQRDLDVDLDAMKAWGAAIALAWLRSTNCTPCRFRLSVRVFASAASSGTTCQSSTLSHPTKSFIGCGFRQVWRRCAFCEGGKVLVHCRGGLGRSGTVAGALLIELGETPERALQKVRVARPGAVETRGQEWYLTAYVPMLEQEGG